MSSVAMDGGLALGGMTQPEPLEADLTLPEGGRSDAEIMLQVKAGDDSAFEYLVQKYRRPMVSFMFRMAHNNAAAEDLAQEVFLRVYRSRASYEASAKFTTWLYRIATNLAVNHARDTRYERPENTVSLDEPDAESGRTLDLPDRTPSAEETIVQRERLAAIRQRVLDDQNNIRRHVNVFVNGENVRFMQGGLTQVSNDSEVWIYPALSGG